MLVASLMMLSKGKGFWWTGQPRSSHTTRSGKSLFSENVSHNISLFHRQRSHRGFEGTYQFEGKELPPMKALPIKATSTVEMMIKDLRDELERPGPLKCFCASPHQIFAKSASQNARNRDKADFTTKVRKLRIN